MFAVISVVFLVIYAIKKAPGECPGPKTKE